YQQVACMAREAARYACVRGNRRLLETGQVPPTASTIQQQAVTPPALGLDSSKLTVQVQWGDEVTGTVSNWDTAVKWPTTTTTSGQVVTNRVRVTVTYQWWPELFLAGPVNLKSVSEVPMAY